MQCSASYSLCAQCNELSLPDQQLEGAQNPHPTQKKNKMRVYTHKLGQMADIQLLLSLAVTVFSYSGIVFTPTNLQEHDKLRFT